MIIAIAEVVDIVSLDWIDTIIHGTSHCPLSISCEVSFLSRSAGVEDTNGICIICPSFSEGLLKWSCKFLKGITFRLRLDAHLPQLLVPNVSAEHWLNYVSSIKAIHAVDSNVTDLLLVNWAWSIVDLISLVKTILKGCHEIFETIQFVFDLINQLW